MLGKRTLQIVGLVGNARAMSLREDRGSYGVRASQWTGAGMPNARSSSARRIRVKVSPRVVSALRAVAALTIACGGVARSAGTATLIPARRAASAQPEIALRAE